MLNQESKQEEIADQKPKGGFLNGKQVPPVSDGSCCGSSGSCCGTETSAAGQSDCCGPSSVAAEGKSAGNCSDNTTKESSCGCGSSGCCTN